MPDITVENTFVRSREKLAPITEKDLEKKNDGSPMPRRPEDITIKNLKTRIFSFTWACRSSKSWEALRGKAS